MLLILITVGLDELVCSVCVTALFSMLSAVRLCLVLPNNDNGVREKYTDLVNKPGSALSGGRMACDQ